MTPTNQQGEQKRLVSDCCNAPITLDTSKHLLYCCAKCKNTIGDDPVDDPVKDLLKLLYMRRINTGALLNDYRRLHPKNSKKDTAETSFYEGKIEAYERCLQTILEIFEIKEMPIIEAISLRENPET